MVGGATKQKNKSEKYQIKIKARKTKCVK